jgi:hypothetical protein
MCICLPGSTDSSALFQSLLFLNPSLYAQAFDGPLELPVSSGASELSPESSTGSECATLQAIDMSRAAGHDTILIAGHSGTLSDNHG